MDLSNVIEKLKAELVITNQVISSLEKLFEIHSRKQTMVEAPPETEKGRNAKKSAHVAPESASSAGV